MPSAHAEIEEDRCSTLQCSTVQYVTVQYVTVQCDETSFKYDEKKEKKRIEIKARRQY